MSIALDGPIVVGPWRVEVGTEVAYWMPFVKKLAASVPNFWERTTVISRGGMGKLYGPAANVVDLFSLRSVDDVRTANQLAKEQLGVNKPVSVLEWEQELAESVSPGAWLVHPSSMVSLCSDYWAGRLGWQDVTARMDLTPIVKPPKPAWLPERYTAVKWYHREGKVCGEVPAWERISAALERETPLVWVGQGEGYDKHTDAYRCGLEMPPCTPEENLFQQAAVIAHADRFVGTYGGTAHLALRLAVPTVTFWPESELRHREWTQIIARKTGTPYISGSLRDLDLMRAVCL